MSEKKKRIVTFDADTEAMVGIGLTLKRMDEARERLKRLEENTLDSAHESLVIEAIRS